MLNLSRISPIADFCSEINTSIKVLNGNVLYVTHEVDKIKKLLNKLLVDKDLQNTVDQYFDKDETSPQTDSEEQ